MYLMYSAAIKTQKRMVHASKPEPNCCHFVKCIILINFLERKIITILIRISLKFVSDGLIYRKQYKKTPKVSYIDSSVLACTNSNFVHLGKIWITWDLFH